MILLFLRHCYNSEQVFLNLISNAIKYSDEGVITLRTYKEDIYCVCEVEDQGKGMKSQHCDYIFDRFYRVDKARSRAAGGAGLGLSIVRDMVLRNYGTISVGATERGGTEFTVRFPLYDTQEEMK